MTYENKITLLDKDDFFALFEYLHAQPRWVTSNGKQSIQILGLCHHGESHSALFDPTTLKVNCFSACGGGMLLHTWVKRALDLPHPDFAKQFIEDWIEGKQIDLSDRIPINADFEYIERPFELKYIEPVKGIPQEIIDRLYAKFLYDEDTLAKLK